MTANQPQPDTRHPSEAESLRDCLGSLGIKPKPPARGMAAKSPRGSVYDQITQRITDLLEAGTIPWQKSWNVKTGMPRNIVSKRPYRGINFFLLLSMRYESPFWLTFNQAHQLGGYIRKGEKACPVVFCKQMEVEDKVTGEQEKFRLLRYYHVFNANQCENLKNVPPLSDQFATITRPAELVERMPQRPEIKHGMTSAFYSPPDDVVGMPCRERFTGEEA